MATTTKRRKSTDEATPAPAALPLFFKQPAVIERARHATATVRDPKDYAFARATNAIPVNGAEFLEAARAYPIIFTNAEQPMPMVCVGLEKENYFVNAEGQWLANHYIPAHVRQYPFVLFEQEVEGKEGESQLFLCVDEASALFNNNPEEGAHELYAADGKPSKFSENTLAFCQAVLQQHQMTRHFCADLKKHGLLSPYQTKLELNSGKSITLSDFLAINEKAFNELSPEVFLEFRQKGWIALIYLVMFSSSNWRIVAELAGK